MPRELFRLQGTFKKLEAAPRRIVAGYANMAIVDHEGDLITVEAWEKASIRFMASGFENVNIQHQNITVGRVIPEFTDHDGKLWKTHVDENGWFVVCEIRTDLLIADLAWDLIEKRKLREFSISGTALPESTEIVCVAGEGCHRRISDLEMYEVTLCETGINPGTAFAILKSKGCCEKCTATLCMKSMDFAELSKSRLQRLDRNVDTEKTLENQSKGEKENLTKPTPETPAPVEKQETPPPSPSAPAPAAAPTPTPSPAPPATQKKQEATPPPDMAALVSKLDAILELLQNLTADENEEEDEEDEEDGNEESAPPGGMMTAAKAEAPAPAAPPATPSPTDIPALVAAEVKKAVDELKANATPQKRSKVPGAGTPAAPVEQPVIELVKKAQGEAGWTGVEALAEQVLLKAQGRA
jgi:hypothetical protein